jgi:amino acid adenylation domain-containing protein
MSITDLITDLSHRGVRLWLDGDQVRFKAPQGTLTSDLKEQLVQHKSDLLEFLRQVQSSLESSTPPPINPVPRDGDAPLSYSQERLWFATQWEPESAAYNISDAVVIDGRIDLPALEKSLNEIIRRHEILRTSFVVNGGQPGQRIAPEAHVDIKLIDLQHLESLNRDAELQRTINAETSIPFDLSHSPLLRVVLIKLEAERHVLLFSSHHIISDGWSTGVLIHELVALYSEFANNRPSPLPPLPIQYADFAIWQRQWLAGERLESERAFWREQLKGAPATLDLPADKPRPAIRTSFGATRHFNLSPSLSSAVRELSRQERVTPFMVLLAAWNVLLWKYTGQEDVLVGSAHAHRNRTELENLIGFFVNSLVLRTNLSGNPSFRDLLARVREVTISAQAHQDLPFEKLVDELQLERDLSRTPVYQVAFTFQNAPEAELTAPGLTLSRLQLPSQTSKFDLTLIITDSEPSMTGELEYSTDLFDEDTIASMAGHLETLLANAVAQPEQRLSELRMLTEDERHQLVTKWNDTTTNYPSESSIQELFEQQVQDRPEAVALISGQQHVSYRELNERANRLAHYLRELGVGPEIRVGICLERAVDMIVGLLAILKAGGTYVPLDPEYPIDRLAFMIEESNVFFLLTDESLEESLPSSGAHVIIQNAEQDEISKCPAENPANLSGPENLAYVMFTSGSTGKPKGIGVTHRNVVRLVKQTDYAYFDAEQRFLHFAPISFDASTFEIWGSLLNGASLVVFPQKQASLEELGQVIREQRVTVLWLTAGLFHQMVESRLDDLKQLRQLLAGGDVLSTHHVRKVVQELDGCRLTNGYGPTEGTTFTCCYTVDDESTLRSNVPIGRPIANTYVYILDASLQPAPVGVTGELYIAGDGVAHGYLNDPLLTAEKFIPNPFASEPGARMYRTGDLARYLPNGDIEFLGRIDYQLKIRGFRIEPGEIESLLSRYSAIAQTVVIARENGAGHKQLVAYLVPEEDTAVSIADLKNYLKQHFPDYMIPSAFVLMDQLPLTPNGKVDRKALPAPEKTTATDGYTSPRTEGEELLAEIWADTLQLERVDINDNFFELGGHSLLATQIVSRITDNFHVSLPLRALFESPTVAGLSERIQTALISGQDTEVPPIVPVSREKGLPLSFAQENLWLFEQLTPGTPTYNTCRSGRIWGPLDTAALEWAFNDLLQRHEALRTSYEMLDSFPVQIVHPHEHYKLPIVDISSLPEDEREAEALRLSSQDAQSPIDITKSPVARAKLLRLGDEEHVFILSIHHIAYDLWSGGVLLGEMEQLYLAHVAGESPALPVLPVQCADFGVWQRNWLQGDVLERQLAYWKEKLGGLSATPLDLPSDRPRPAVETMNGASEYVRFPKPLNEGIQALARREGVTQFMALLAVFQVLLHRYTNQDDLTAGSVIANRNRAELDGVVGFFDNPIVLRVDASGNPTFREFLHRVRDVALGAYANQYVPFDLIVKELQPERTSNRTPFIQAMFVFLLNYPAMEREIAGLKVVPYNLQSGKAMFDLLFGLRASERGLEGELAYNCDLFDASTIARMCRHFGQLLEAVVADPDQRIRELNMLSAEEQRQVLVEWNETQRDYEADHGLKDLFERQVERTPEHVAISCAGDQITFSHLNQRANQLAHYLRSRGVGPEAQVGICMERSIDLVVGILGVLKAGGAYVPLDPDYPAARVEYMLSDAGASVLITSTKVQRIAPEASVERIYLDAGWNEITSEGTANPESITGPDNLAYVIYTSGSTGRPKGVGITNRSVVSFLNWANEVYPEQVHAGLLAATSVCFDLSIFELFLPLCFGGRIILVDNVLALPGLSEKEEVTLINSVPSAIRELVNDDVLPRSARIVNLAGEPLSAELARKLYATLPEHRLYNLYGPTETTTYSTSTSIASSVAVTPGIGQPIANTCVYVLDRDGKPAGTGVPGELYIGGAGLARGYLNRPELTAEKFVPNPFSVEPGARMYRTGDRVRWLADGTLEFLGRIDHQVKLRGYRIELGEIESVLASHPSVREAVVLVSDDPVAGQRLVAYLVSTGETKPSVAELRAYLQGKLPGYMVPSAFVTLRELPLTPNGKLDRKALPAPTPTVREGTPAEPLTLSEELVAGVWRQVLGVDRVGRVENFFELGGHSLLATQIISRVQKLFGVAVELRQLFANPTVAGLATQIEIARRSGHDMSLAPIARVSRNGELPLSFAQQRLWFLDKLVANSPVYNLPSALRLVGRLNIDALEQVLTEIVRRHEALRTTFPEVDGEPVQLIAPPAPVSLPLFDLSTLDPAAREHEARRLAEAEAGLPFNLSTGPLLRASVLRLGDEEHVVLLNMHHIVSDGWSMGVLLRELTSLYKAFANGQDSPLPELPIQYADFAAWQRQWLSGEVLETQLRFWKEQLSEVPVLQLPADKPRPPVQSFTGAHEDLALSPELSAAIKALSQREGATLFMTLLAAFNALLSYYSGQHDLVVGTPVASRNREAIEGLIGFFANTLVLRTRLSGDMSFSDLLAEVREVALNAYTHQDVPFEKLVDELQIERDFSRNPLVQVFCVLQNLPSTRLEMAGLNVDVVEADVETTKFDLTLYVTETEDGLLTAFEYSSELFEAATIKRMLKHYEQLLGLLVIAPERRLSEISLLTEEEHQELLGRVNQWRTAPVESKVKAEPAYVAPRDEIEFGLTRIWERLFEIEAVGIRDSFFDLGGHSLLGVRLVSLIEKEFGRELPLIFLLENPTVEELAGWLRQEAPSLRRSALVPIRADGTRTPFFCVHPVGGNVLCYASLARELGTEQPFYAFQLPVLDGESQPRTIEAMAQHYLQHLRGVQPDGPYRLGGWSMGGVIAFEMARQLEMEGERVQLLALIDSHLPQDSDRREQVDEHDLLRMFVADLEGVTGASLRFSLDDVRRHSLEESLEVLLQKARDLAIVPDELGLPELRGLFDLYRTNLSALITYEPKPYAGTVTIFSSNTSDSDPALDWTPFATNVEVNVIEGDHYSIVNGPSVKVLAASLREMLDHEEFPALSKPAGTSM